MQSAAVCTIDVTRIPWTDPAAPVPNKMRAPPEDDARSFA